MNSFFFKFQGFMPWLETMQANYEEVAVIPGRENEQASFRKKISLNLDDEDDPQEQAILPIKHSVQDHLELIKFQLLSYTTKMIYLYLKVLPDNLKIFEEKKLIVHPFNIMLGCKNTLSKDSPAHPMLNAMIAKYSKIAFYDNHLHLQICLVLDTIKKNQRINKEFEESSRYSSLSGSSGSARILFNSEVNDSFGSDDAMEEEILEEWLMKENLTVADNDEVSEILKKEESLRTLIAFIVDPFFYPLRYTINAKFRKGKIPKGYPECFDPLFHSQDYFIEQEVELTIKYYYRSKRALLVFTNKVNMPFFNTHHRDTVNLVFGEISEVLAVKNRYRADPKHITILLQNLFIKEPSLSTRWFIRYNLFFALVPWINQAPIRELLVELISPCDRYIKLDPFLKKKFYKYLGYSKFFKFLFKAIWRDVESTLEKKRNKDYIKARNENLVKDIQYKTSKQHYYERYFDTLHSTRRNLQYYAKPILDGIVGHPKDIDLLGDRNDMNMTLEDGGHSSIAGRRKSISVLQERINKSVIFDNENLLNEIDEFEAKPKIKQFENVNFLGKTGDRFKSEKSISTIDRTITLQIDEAKFQVGKLVRKNNTVTYSFIDQSSIVESPYSYMSTIMLDTKFEELKINPTECLRFEETSKSICLFLKALIDIFKLERINNSYKEILLFESAPFELLHLFESCIFKQEADHFVYLILVSYIFNNRASSTSWNRRLTRGMR